MAPYNDTGLFLLALQRRLEGLVRSRPQNQEMRLPSPSAGIGWVAYEPRPGEGLEDDAGDGPVIRGPWHGVTVLGADVTANACTLRCVLPDRPGQWLLVTPTPEETDALLAYNIVVNRLEWLLRRVQARHDGDDGAHKAAALRLDPG